MTRHRSLALLLAATIAVVVVVAIASSGSEAEADEALVVRSDNQEKGDLDLGAQRIRITPKGLWTRVFWVELEGLTEGEEILARVNIQLTNCRPSDLTAASTSSCKGTAPYGFSPQIEAKLILAEAGPDGGPLSNGTVIGDPTRLECTKKLHHCVPALFGSLRVGASDTGNRFVALVARATDPKAKRCRPARPPDCNVLQLSHDEGRLGVVRERRPGLEPPMRRTGNELASELRMAKTSVQKKRFSEVVYSIELDRPGALLIKAKLNTAFELDYPVPPLVNKQLVLADSASATTGSTVEPQNGENCQGACTYLQPGVLPCLTAADLDAGRSHLNLVAFSSRGSAFASPKHGVEVRDGGFLEAAQYDASLSPAECG